MWAILSGIEGNLAAYEAVIGDMKSQRRNIEALYILGDLVGASIRWRFFRTLIVKIKKQKYIE